MRQKKLLVCISLIVFLFSGGWGLAACPSADQTGDCIVSLEDFVVMAGQWLDERVMPYSDLRRDDIAAQEAEMSIANIDGSDGNEFMPGTYFIYKTDEGRFGKFMVDNYEPTSSYDMVIRWVTYGADGSVYSHGTRLVIRGNWTCDLDEGLETATGKDWDWVIKSATIRYLSPQNDAKFKLMHRANAPDDMVWVYIDDTATGASGYKGYMSKYETTNRQYCQYLNAALTDRLITVHNDVVYASDDKSYSEPYFETYAATSWSQITYSSGEFSVRIRDLIDMSNHPVVYVTWYGSMAFANYYGFKLPTEWQWQAVADYDGTYTYGCGTTIDPNMANYQSDNPLGLTSYPYTTHVDYYASYGYGMNDMAGNAYEWTESCYYDQREPDSRVLRGGYWSAISNYCLVAARSIYDPMCCFYYLGFRVCR